MSYENDRLRKIVILVVLVFILIFFGLLGLYIKNTHSTGSVTIKTDSPANYVKIEQVASSNNKNSGVPFSQQAPHSLSVKVAPGSYEIFAYNNNGLFGVSQTIAVKAGQRLSFSLNPTTVTTTSPEPVYGQTASGVVANGSQLSFVALGSPVDNVASGNIIQVDSANNFSTLFPDHSFTSVKWASPMLGLAQDYYNNLYVINNGQLSQLTLPFAVNANSKESFDISTGDEIYVSNGKDVYSGNLGGGFKKIYSTDSDHPVSNLSAGSGKVAVVMNAVEALESERNGSETSGALAIVDDNGRYTKKSMDISQTEWSPSGDKLIAQGSLSNTVFDASLNVLKTIAINNSNNFTWFTNDSLLYSIDSQVWLYGLQTQKSTTITSLAAKEAITGIYPSKDGAYVYFSDDNGEKTQLFRVGLKGQAVDNSLAALSIFLPETLDGCQLNFINFAQPSIIINYPSSTSQQNCLGLAYGELQTYNLDVNKFQYKFIPLP